MAARVLNQYQQQQIVTCKQLPTTLILPMEVLMDTLERADWAMDQRHSRYCHRTRTPEAHGRCGQIGPKSKIEFCKIGMR